MNFDNYSLEPTIYDEMFLPEGTPRPEAQVLYEALRELSGAGPDGNPGQGEPDLFQRKHLLHRLRRR